MKSKHRDVHGSQSFAILKVSLQLSGYILLLLLQQQILCCPTVCQFCTERQAECRGLGLTSIPKNFPKTTTLIYLSGNNITQVSPNDFTELQKLAVLYLDNSSVFYIYPRAFASLKKLYYLYLNDNSVKHLNPGTFDGLSSLKYLHLQHNQITFLPQGLFDHLIAVRYLTLHRNQLSVLDSDVFAGMISLQTLNLANNNISHISDSAFRYLENLEQLYLEGNYLMQVPSHALGLLKNLKRLSLSNNPLGSVPNFAFRGLDSLQYLFLENASIQIIYEKSFFGLNNLKQLILSRNELRVLDSKMFSYLTHLMFLQLDRNGIVNISDHTFEEMGVTLKVLNLAFNNLTFLPINVLQPLVSLTNFHASYNPWDCGCNLLEMRKFLLSSSFTFSIHCHNPPELRGRPLRNIKGTEFENCLTTDVFPKISPRVAAPTTVAMYNHMKSARYNPYSDGSSEGVDDILTSTESSFLVSTRTNVTQNTTELSLLRLEIPLLLSPVNLTRETDNLFPPDIVTISMKPYVICQQQVYSLNQSFHILLSFFILSCAVIIFLIFKFVQLKRRIVSPENQADSVLEYYSCYQSGRYQLTDSARVTPQNPLPTPDIDLIRPIKQSTPETQTQVILFEHSAL
ncbi:leucine-rich repeat-containing protein 70 [Rhinophrynus dorsalis]